MELQIDPPDVFNTFPCLNACSRDCAPSNGLTVPESFFIRNTQSISLALCSNPASQGKRSGRQSSAPILANSRLVCHSSYIVPIVPTVRVAIHREQNRTL
jgi:hypothetical protein